MQNSKDNQYYLDKQDQLNKALKRVTDKLELYKSVADRDFHNVYETLTEDRRNHYRDLFTNVWKWNNWHDLQYRLENRLKDNYSEYCDWHFQKFGWVSL